MAGGRGVHPLLLRRRRQHHASPRRGASPAHVRRVRPRGRRRHRRRILQRDGGRREGVRARDRRARAHQPRDRARRRLPGEPRVARAGRSGEAGGSRVRRDPPAWHPGDRRRCHRRPRDAAFGSHRAAHPARRAARLRAGRRRPAPGACFPRAVSRRAGRAGRSRRAGSCGQRARTSRLRPTAATSTRPHS